MRGEWRELLPSCVVHIGKVEHDHNIAGDDAVARLSHNRVALTQLRGAQKIAAPPQLCAVPTQFTAADCLRASVRNASLITSSLWPRKRSDNLGRVVR